MKLIFSGQWPVGLLVVALLCQVSGNRLKDLDEKGASTRHHPVHAKARFIKDDDLSDRRRVDLVFSQGTSSKEALNADELAELLRSIGLLFALPKSNETTHQDHNGSTHQMNLKLNCVTRKLEDLNEFVSKMFQSSSHDDAVTIKSDKFSFLNELVDTYLDACFSNLPAFQGHNDLKGKMTVLDDPEGLVVSGVPKSGFVINKKNWIYAFLSGTFIGLVGLLCYTIMPMLNLFYFGFFLQFLVAMAVGSLIGDALLHLIPQAFSNESALACGGPMAHHMSAAPMKAGHHMDQSAVLKGAGAVIGIYFFFLIEKFMRLHRTRCEKKQQLKSGLAKNASNGNLKSQSQSQPAAAEENTNRLESYSMYEESAFDAKSGRDKYVSTDFNRIKFEDDSDNGSSSISTNENKSQVNLNLLDDSLPLLPLELDEAAVSQKKKNKDNKTSSLAKKDSSLVKQHCHQRHYDSKDFENVKLVAWMVIMGDGLHNFTDGLAIGASFANSITAGLGTSIAVLFHELPHEIGDFAVLRRSGVTLRKAILFNAFSGFLCLVGVGVGLFIGTVEIFSKWSLLFTAGVFLYIALVDMIPELSEDKETVLNILIQAVGVFVGVGVMLFIALFQDKIINLLQ